jgi:diguanylate cyclase (GGDEF)-like protein
VVRYGGEEILVVVEQPEGATSSGPQGDHLDALAERIRAFVEALDLDAAAPGLRVTVSLGVATSGPDETLTSAIGRADQAMYAAKESGRNRVVRAPVSELAGDR